ncbi:arylsulfatase [Paenibacillus apiarius]|uniref:Arylsulfatase n=1 Tax=Paenibacillus apiarius TaxID=46240 RepID=A0ABT4DPG4_9BACL|nr:arylsulfatase [Paenibacillus apiarius]MCY9515675.1 arylsulfatase [Paenibacillus apiarius]MCY9519252.1 arylsulfatase [Paenibacillus apiarius]MCY9550888.1 arylsulfatase [Paenibacillus apiarius]MCY9559020.1 arylsulfatase [Paenibacillus apiarius]MCY9683503.1 arylsulfatase [Paenibacillus apiarius]
MTHTKTTSKRPNVLLITVDQMRFDSLSIAGHSIVETPNLDELARTGVRFDRAYSATPTCVPARAAIFTGQSQRSHGRVGYRDCVPWNYDTTLPGELAKAGYHTQCVGKMHVYPARSLLGFHNVVLHDGYLHHNRYRHNVPAQEHFDQLDDYLTWLRERVPGADLTDLGLDCNASTVARPWHLPEMLHPTNWCVTQSIDFLRRRDPSKPFFLWMSFVRPHPPFDPPQAYLDLYKDIEIPDPPVGDWTDKEDPTQEGLNPVTFRGNVPTRRLKYAMAAYYALITHLDHQIGRFPQVLNEYGELNDTIMVFTSDHGELLGDHNLFRKSLPYEGSTRVPFIINDPGNRLGLKRGTVAEEVVEMRDIMPTLLDAAGVAVPSSVEGKSVIGIGRGDDDTDWRDYLHGEQAQGNASNHWVTNGKEKFIWFSQTGEEQYFNLEQDPNELHNAVNELGAQERVGHWRSVLIRDLEGCEEGYSDGEKLVIGRKPIACLSHIL